jgi:hypothetical protein
MAAKSFVSSVDTVEPGRGGRARSGSRLRPMFHRLTRLKQGMGVEPRFGLGFGQILTTKYQARFSCFQRSSRETAWAARSVCQPLAGKPAASLHGIVTLMNTVLYNRGEKASAKKYRAGLPRLHENSKPRLFSTRGSSRGSSTRPRFPGPIRARILARMGRPCGPEQQAWKTPGHATAGIVGV